MTTRIEKIKGKNKVRTFRIEEIQMLTLVVAQGKKDTFRGEVQQDKIVQELQKLGVTMNQKSLDAFIRNGYTTRGKGINKIQLWLFTAEEMK